MYGVMAAISARLRWLSTRRNQHGSSENHGISISESGIMTRGISASSAGAKKWRHVKEIGMA